MALWMALQPVQMALQQVVADAAAAAEPRKENPPETEVRGGLGRVMLNYMGQRGCLRSIQRPTFSRCVRHQVTNQDLLSLHPISRPFKRVDYPRGCP